jgi:hypothetical protein
VNLVHFESIGSRIVAQHFEVRIFEASVVENLRRGLIALELNVPVILKLKIRGFALLLPQMSPNGDTRRIRCVDDGESEEQGRSPEP